MDSQDRELLHRLIKVSEENNEMLRGIRRTLRWGQIWGFVKVAIILVPFVIGYFYLQPYFGSLGTGVKQAQELFKSF